MTKAQTMWAGVNCLLTLNENMLRIEIDLSKEFGESKSGKTKVIASTLGFVNLAGVGKPDILVGVNVNKKK